MLNKLKKVLVLVSILATSVINPIKGHGQDWYYSPSPYQPWYNSDGGLQTSLNNGQFSFLYINIPSGLYYDANGQMLSYVGSFAHKSNSRGANGSLAFQINGVPKISLSYEGWTTHTFNWPAGSTSPVQLSWYANGYCTETISSLNWNLSTPNPLVIYRANGGIVKISWAPWVYPTQRLYYAYSIVGPWYLDTTPVNTVPNGFKFVLVPANKSQCYFILK